jgi:hypothetical protein
MSLEFVYLLVVRTNANFGDRKIDRVFMNNCVGILVACNLRLGTYLFP